MSQPKWRNSKAKKPLPKERMPSKLEAAFITCWKIHVATLRLDRIASELSEPWPEFPFDSSRRWRFDFAWPHARVAVELDGGQWRKSGKSAHSGGAALQRNNEKSNAANLQGWCLLRYTTNDLEKRPMQCVEEVAAAIVAKSIT